MAFGEVSHQEDQTGQSFVIPYNGQPSVIVHMPAGGRDREIALSWRGELSVDLVCSWLKAYHAFDQEETTYVVDEWGDDFARARIYRSPTLPTLVKDLETGYKGTLALSIRKGAQEAQQYYIWGGFDSDRGLNGPRTGEVGVRCPVSALDFSKRRALLIFLTQGSLIPAPSDGEVEDLFHLISSKAAWFGSVARSA